MQPSGLVQYVFMQGLHCLCFLPPLLLNVATDRLDSVCNILDVISLLVFVDLPFPSSLDRGFQCVWLEKVVQNLFFFRS